MKYFIVLFIFLISCSQDTGSGIEITNAWIREVPPGSSVSALYLEIKNKGSEDSIVAISSPVSEIAEIHSTEITPDGTASMVRLETISIPSNGEIHFNPGGKHIMLINLKEGLKAGDLHEVRLEFKNSGVQSVSAVVKGLDSNGEDGHTGHSMDH